MHDQLRDLAHSIVREEGGSILQRTRLLGRDVENALKEGVRSQNLLAGAYDLFLRQVWRVLIYIAYGIVSF